MPKTKAPLRLLWIIWFIFLFLITFGKTLGFYLYGDDWFIISIFFSQFGPGRAHPYSQSYQLFFSNYGSQFLIMPFLYQMFKEFALPYFLLSMVFRLGVVWALYCFIKKVATHKEAILAASFFSISAIGSETTDWVYNMPTYIGLSLVLFGLCFVLVHKNSKESLWGWILTIIGYLVAIIRIFFIPFLLIVVAFFGNLVLTRTNVFKSLIKAFGAFAPFLILKVFLPGLGLQTGYLYYVSEGLKIASDTFAAGRYDIVLYPFVFLGRMVLPWGLEDLAYRTHWQFYPFSAFVFTGGILGIIGVLVFWFVVAELSKKGLVKSVILAFIPLLGLKIFTRYQGRWALSEFTYFVWAYLGMVVTISMTLLLIRGLKAKNYKAVSTWVITMGFALSFIFPWSYDPRTIFIPQHRYLIAPAIGMTIWTVFVFLPTAKFKYIQGIFLTVAILVQIVSVRTFFESHFNARRYDVASQIFSQLKEEIPEFPKGATSVVYIEDAKPLLFEELFRFGFGYHMQLFYNLDFVEKDFPYGVGSWPDLVRAVSDPSFPRLIGDTRVTRADDVFAFRLEGDRLVNITTRVRKDLRIYEKN